jgi:hypothetical protein
MNLKKIRFQVQTELICCRIYFMYVVGCCKYGNEPSVPIKSREFLGQ